MQGEQNRLRSFGWADLVVLSTVLIWGMNFVIVKASLASFTPLVFNAMRFTLAALLETTILFLRGENLSVNWKDFRRLLPIALIGILAYQVLFIYGINLTSAGNSSVLLATIPIFVGLYASLFMKEAQSRCIWIGALLTFLGVGLVTLGAGNTPGAGSSTLKGDVLILLSAICWAVYTVNSKSVMRAISPLKLTSLTMLMTAPLLNVLAVPEYLATEWSTIPLAAWAGLIASAVFGIALAYLFWNIGVQQLGDTRTAIYSNLTPVVSLAAAWVLLGEYLTFLQIVGVAIVLFGIWTSRNDPRTPAGSAGRPASSKPVDRGRLYQGESCEP